MDPLEKLVPMPASLYMDTCWLAEALALHMFDKCHVAPVKNGTCAITPFPQLTCSSLCPWLLSWLLQRHLSPLPSVDSNFCGVPSSDVIVRGIPSCVSFGGMQLV